LLEPYRGSSLRGVFHAFTGDTGEAEHIIDSGFLLGIGGIVTFRNAGLDRVVKDIGIEHLVLETDSPYLAPAPNRGKRNESAFIKLIAEKISEITGVKIEKVGELTTANAVKLFKLDK
jgi:TatD DNase family protein